MSNPNSQEYKIHLNWPSNADIKVASFKSVSAGQWVPYCTICQQELDKCDENLHNPVDLV